MEQYGKFNNADSTDVHTFPFMLHISSTPVVKYLVVIRAYLFKWWGNIKYHRLSAQTGQWLSTDVCQLRKACLSVCVCVCVSACVNQEYENGEAMSSWRWLKLPLTSALKRRHNEEELMRWKVWSEETLRSRSHQPCLVRSNRTLERLHPWCPSFGLVWMQFETAGVNQTTGPCSAIKRQSQTVCKWTRERWKPSAANRCKEKLASCF